MEKINVPSSQGGQREGLKIALFAGSFDPFTIGHKNIVDRALKSVADEVIIAIGINYEKKYMFSLEERLQAIQKSL